MVEKLPNKTNTEETAYKFNPALERRKDKDSVDYSKLELYPESEHGYDCFVKDVEEVMMTPSGRRVLWRLLEISKVNGDNNNTNANVYVQEGKRMVGNVFWRAILCNLLHKWVDIPKLILSDKEEIRLNLINKKGGY